MIFTRTSVYVEHLRDMSSATENTKQLKMDVSHCFTFEHIKLPSCAQARYTFSISPMEWLNLVRGNRAESNHMHFAKNKKGT